MYLRVEAKGSKTESDSSPTEKKNIDMFKYLTNKVVSAVLTLLLLCPLKFKNVNYLCLQELRHRGNHASLY